MTITGTIVLNVLLGLVLVASLVWLLGHLGINRDRRHRRRLHSWHRHRRPAKNQLF